MSNVQSYNALIDRFKAFASGHFILKSFSHGQIDTADLEKFTEYPFMHVVPSNVTYAKGTKTFSFQIVLADLPRDKDDKVEFQREVLSDLQRIAEDLVAEITNHRVLFGDLITVQNVSLEPFLEEFHNTLTGWTVSLELLVPYYWDACSIPAEWNDMFESSTGGTGSILTFIDSITRDEYGNVSLVNDEAEPAPNYYYGTNDEGVRGWYLLTDEVGLTCATIGTCQTIIDIESAIDDLQTEIALKANTADLGAVAFSNDYNDLDNLPNLSGYGDMFKSVYDTDVDGVVDSAERIQIVVRNSTGSTLTKGQIVYLSGATGNRPNAVLAQANAELTSSKTIGMIIADIANNADGQVAVNGTLHDLDTSAFTAGDTLWLSATTAGGMVANTPPSEPNHAVFIGYVARSHPNLGRIVLAIQNGYELDELHGVQITTPANNEVLTYESSTSLWKNKTVATALGYTPVPTTRSITINGTTQDLSADRTFTIATGLTVGTTPITSGTVGRVLFEGTGNVLQESANLFWDNTNGRLGIGTASPTSSLNVRGAGTSSATTTLLVQNSAGTSMLQLRDDNYQLVGNWLAIESNRYLYRALNALGIFTLANDSTGATFVNLYGSSHATLANVLDIGTASTSRLRIAANGNVLIGTTTDAGFKLDVNGTARVTGGITMSNFTNITSGSNVISFQTFRTIFYATFNTLANQYAFNFDDGGGSGTQTSGTTGRFQLSSSFAPTSGTGVYNTFLLNATINQTGGANGITRGIYINPTLTAAADFRAIEVTAGNVMLNTTSGNTLIGTTTNAGFKLDVNGTARVKGVGTTTGVTFNVQNGSSTNLVTVTDAGSLTITTSNFSSVITNDANSFQVTGSIAAIRVGSSVSIAASAILQADSTTKGFLPPRMTTTQKNAIASPAAGLVVYDTTLNKLCVYTTAWETITSV